MHGKPAAAESLSGMLHYTAALATDMCTPHVASMCPALDQHSLLLAQLPFNVPPACCFKVVQRLKALQLVMRLSLTLKQQGAKASS